MKATMITLATVVAATGLGGITTLVERNLCNEG